MKKTLFIIILMYVGITYSQEIENKRSIEQNDIKQLGDHKTITDVYIYLENADKKEMPVNISLYVPDSIYNRSEMNPGKLRNMILNSYYNALVKCKNKYTFVAKKIRIFFYDEKDLWIITTTFTAQNDFGATKDSDAITYFDKTGTTEISEMELILKELEEKDSKKGKKKKKN